MVVYRLVVSFDMGREKKHLWGKRLKTKRKGNYHPIKSQCCQRRHGAIKVESSLQSLQLLRAYRGDLIMGPRGSNNALRDLGLSGRQIRRHRNRLSASL